MHRVKEDTKPFFTEEQYHYLAGLFPEVDVRPGIPTEELMYIAGARRVVQVVATRTQGIRRVRVGD